MKIQIKNFHKNFAKNNFCKEKFKKSVKQKKPLKILQSF